MRYVKRALSIGSVALTVIASTGFCLAANLPSIYTYAGPDRQQAIVSGARREGTVTWYTTQASHVLQTLKNAFERKYPFETVDIYRGTSSTLNARAIQEYLGHRQTFDVTDPTEASLLALRHYGILAPYYLPAASHLDKEMIRSASPSSVFWVVERESYVGFAYNTKLLPYADVPKRFSGLANLRLKGKMAISGETTGIRWVGSVEAALGRRDARTLLANIARQDIQVQGISGQALLDLIAKGEVIASPTIYQAHVDQLRKLGAPVKWVPLNLVTTNAGGVAVAANAPHPNSAILLAEFLLGSEAKKILTAAGFGVPGSEPSFKRWYPEADLSAEQYAKAYQRWTRIFNQTFRAR